MNNVESINGAVKMAESVSNYGFMAVAGGVVLFLFILIMGYFIWLQRQNDKRAAKLQEQNDKRYNDYINNLTNTAKDEHQKQLSAIETANGNLAQLIYQQSNLYEKAQTVIEVLLQNSAHLTIREINNIKHENGKDDREMTHCKCVDRAIKIADFRKRRMAIFQYKGKCLNEACDTKFTEKVIELMHKEIYREGENSYIATRNAVEELYDNQSEEMLQRIKLW
jgi:ABC-type transport system involved in cytochrome bd biosynthesis fused ATPase/permease subunit